MLDAVADVVVDTADPDGALVTFTTPAASDVVDVSPVVDCDQISGSQFPVGISTVTCSAVDGSGNAATTTFDIEAVFVCTIVGTSGNDVLVGTDGDDIICGLAGDDIVLGMRGDDYLGGGPGDDLLIVGPGEDILIQ